MRAGRATGGSAWTRSGGSAPPCSRSSPEPGRCGSGTGGPGTPFDLDGDGPFVSMQLRDLADHGWYWHNTDLGYPFGQVASFFPELNVLHVGIVKALGLAASDPYTPGVVYFVLGFPLAAATMFALARSQGLSRWAAAGRRRAVRERPGPPGALPPPVAGRLLGGSPGHVGGARGAARQRVLRARPAGARHPVMVAGTRGARRDGHGRDRPERCLLRGVHPAPARGGHARPAVAGRDPAGDAAGSGAGARGHRGVPGSPRGRPVGNPRRGAHRAGPRAAQLRRVGLLRRQDDGPRAALDRAPRRPARVPRASPTTPRPGRPSRLRPSASSAPSAGWPSSSSP